MPSYEEIKADEAREMREFETGATRNDDSEELDYEGFLSPIVLMRFAQYMHEHRRQADGQLRDSDNWQKGIPQEAYRKSLVRHTVDVWLHGRGAGELARDDLEKALCAVLFNAGGLLFELLVRGEDSGFVPEDQPS